MHRFAANVFKELFNFDVLRLKIYRDVPVRWKNGALVPQIFQTNGMETYPWTYFA